MSGLQPGMVPMAAAHTCGRVRMDGDLMRARQLACWYVHYLDNVDHGRGYMTPAEIAKHERERLASLRAAPSTMPARVNVLTSDPAAGLSAAW